MFTGIVTDESRVLKSQSLKEGLKLTIETPKSWTDLAIGESVNTNGVCLTVTAINETSYHLLLIPETLTKTTFGQHVPEMVNLERALSANERFGGHFVQGHVDTTGVVQDIQTANGYVLEIAFPPEFSQYIIPKGSIALDGVALTVVSCQTGLFRVALIPHTLEHTTLKTLRQGSRVNLEFDMLGKYIVNYMELTQHASR